MPAFLLNTNVISEFAKPKREQRALRWRSEQTPTDLDLSAVTLGEVTRGIRAVQFWRSGTPSEQAVDPRAYLASTLTRLVNRHPASQIDRLMPWACANHVP